MSDEKTKRCRECGGINGAAASTGAPVLHGFGRPAPCDCDGHEAIERDLTSALAEANEDNDGLRRMVRNQAANLSASESMLAACSADRADLLTTVVEMTAALQRIGCQDAGSCGVGETDGLCFVCSAIENAGASS